MGHPNILARGTRPPSQSECLRVLAYARDEERLAWFDRELPPGAIVQNARSVAELVAALVDDPPPRPQILIADFDAMSPVDIVELHTIRERGWFGTLYAVGKVAPPLWRSLRIERVLPALEAGTLRSELARTPFENQTLRIPVAQKR